VAIARDQTATGADQANAATVTLTWTTNPAAGSKILILIGSDTSVTSVKDNGSTVTTFTDDGDNGGSGGWGYIFRADSIHLPASGAYKVTITMSGTAGVVYAAGRSYTGVAAGAPTAHTTGSGTSSTVTLGPVTPAAAGSLVFGGFIDDTGSSAETINSTTSGTSTLFSTGNGTILAGATADLLTAGTAAQTLGWTLGDAPDWGGVIAVYPPTAGTAHAGAAALTGSGTMAIGGSKTKHGTANWSGSGTLAPGGRKSAPGAAQLSGSGTLTAGPQRSTPGSADMSGDGTLLAAGEGTFPGAAGLTGDGSLTADGARQVPGAVALDGLGAFTAGPGPEVPAAAALSGDGTLTAAAARTASAAAAMSGDGTLLSSPGPPLQPRAGLLLAAGLL